MFRGTIHLPDDAEHLDATIVVEAGRVIVEVEGQAICDWEADAVTLEHRPDGILLSLSGESLIISPVDRYGFSDAVEAAREDVPKKRRTFRRTRLHNPHPATGDHPTTAVPAATTQAKPRRNRGWRKRKDPGTDAVPGQPGALPSEPAAPVASGPHDPWIVTDPVPPAPQRAPLADEPQAPEREPSVRSLTDAIRSATASLPGRTQPEQAKPVDINQEIFGEDYDRPDPVPPSAFARLRRWWAGLAPRWRVSIVAAVILVPAAVFASELVATVLVLGGLGACLLGGAGMADPHYTRKLPAQLSEIRLLIAGAAMIVVGFLIGLPSL